MKKSNFNQKQKNRKKNQFNRFHQLNRKNLISTGSPLCICNESRSGNFRRIFLEFFHNGWIELLELHKKKYVSNFKNIYAEYLTHLTKL
jgi:hypothetical protein